MSAITVQPGVIRVTCPYCLTPRSPNEVVRMKGAGLMCWHCYEWHAQALRMLAGEPPTGCQECGLSFQELTAMHPDGNVRMVLVQKDKIYQVLCGACADGYLPKRSELFKGTKFGSETLKV